jgi:site-specific DNA recombinase
MDDLTYQPDASSEVVPQSDAAIAPDTKRAALYLRVSTLKQAAKDDDPEGYSVPAQKEAGYRKAEALDAEVVAVAIDKGESAKTADRREFQKLLGRIRTQRDIDYLIVDKIDRFARNRRDDANLLFELRAAGCQLVSVKENIDDTPAGELLHAIMAGIAEFYSKNLATEALKGMTQKAKVGGTPGRAPIGYINVGRRIDGGREIRVVVIDPERAPLVIWAFEAYASGEWTITSLTEALAAKGLRALPHGGKVPGAIQRAHVAKMLKNRYYLGYVTFRGTEYQGRHQPLIPPSLFDRVQEVLASHARAGEKERTHNHYLKGSVYCPNCGSRLCLTNAKGNYLYFFCIGRHQRRTNCPQPYLAVSTVEQAIERYYATVRLPEAVQDLIRTGLRAELDHQHRQAQPEIAWAKRRVIELAEERKRLARGVVTGAIPGDLARDEHDRIALELEQANKTLMAAKMIYGRIEDALNRVLALVGRCDEVYRRGGPQVRRLSNQFFFDKLLIAEDTEEGAQVAAAVLQEPWATLVSEDFHAAMARNTTNLGPDHWARGSKMNTLVTSSRLGLTCGDVLRLAGRPQVKRALPTFSGCRGSGSGRAGRGVPVPGGASGSSGGRLRRCRG